ncbi:nitroreductase [Temperatibacter marinus]|uniref:Nitroreductase n=1 Tax=Temperatibacter marinus TaxID=1456591 RepID=A0AA52EE63_9PROT|nr:nitroreductase [Temperatibacter marinus]WND01428.1 nitroreductase [Temperatibacter marinus]
MNVSEAVLSRLSVRDFLDKEVDTLLLQEILEKAGRAPSGGNLQPWRLYVIKDESMKAFRKEVDIMFEGANPSQQRPAHLAYPVNLKEPYKTNRYKCGMDLYAKLGIERGDRMKRLEQFRRNFDFFGAPVGLMFYIDKQMEYIQWNDVGIYMQTIMLLLREAGLDSCAQGAWSQFPDLVSRFVGAPEHLMLVSGMSVGYRNPEAEVNRLVTDRESSSVITTFV